ncbi:hypothetical protein HAX54_007836 [Datura stramonium]|uniref:Uncharacterized protein n=1 Tax=Datura stramonium TaxID=4076 RepID=A0ABS8RXD2_DATST|nr:hypothetical protein [Datura stramonium]
MYREFRAIEKRGSRPFIRADELSAQFPSLSEAFLRKRLKHCVDLQKFLVSCLSFGSGLSAAAMNQLPDEVNCWAAASLKGNLQITPWNLSSNFVACTNQGSVMSTTPKAPISNAIPRKSSCLPKGHSNGNECLTTKTEHGSCTRARASCTVKKAKLDPTTISKYARGQRMSSCSCSSKPEKMSGDPGIMSKNLSAVDGEENESDSEVNSDSDSFAGDLKIFLTEDS